MPKYHILRSYTQMPDAPLGDFALHVAAKMTGNANFPTPPGTPAALATLANSYIGSLATATNGTPADTAAKNALQASLITALNQMADYVELTAQNDQVKLLSAGFTLASIVRAQAQVGTTSILSATNIATTKLELELEVADNAWCYIIQTSTVPNVWATALIVTDPHDAVLTGLTPGTTYALRAAAMGSHNQISEWSDTVSHMST